jgi:Domain of unknown function (DUF3560)
VTTRDRRLARVERLTGWAEKREGKATAAFQSSRDATAGIPFGQPIMGGEAGKRHRRAIRRNQDAATRGLKHADMARSMASKASNIAAAVEISVFNDDPDAIERLTARIAEREAERDAMKAANAAFRREHKTVLAAMSSFERDLALPHQSCELTNLGASIRRDRHRLASMESACAR